MVFVAGDRERILSHLLEWVHNEQDAHWRDLALRFF